MAHREALTGKAEVKFDSSFQPEELSGFIELLSKNLLPDAPKMLKMKGCDLGTRAEQFASILTLNTSLTTIDIASQ